jgi:hypothetical protein
MLGFVDRNNGEAKKGSFIWGTSGRWHHDQKREILSSRIKNLITVYSK